MPQTGHFKSVTVLLGQPIYVLKQIRAHWEANDTSHYLNQLFKIPLAAGTSYKHHILSHVSEHIPREHKQNVVRTSLWKTGTPMHHEVTISISDAIE